MSTSLVIRIIGGVCGGAIGTFVSGKIYEFIRKNKIPSASLEEPSEPLKYESKINNAKSFEEILNIQLENETINQEEVEFKIKDKFAIKEPILISHIEINEPTIEVRENIYINDTLYDNYYIDYFSTS